MLTLMGRVYHVYLLPVCRYFALLALAKISHQLSINTLSARVSIMFVFIFGPPQLNTSQMTAEHYHDLAVNLRWLYVIFHQDRTIRDDHTLPATIINYTHP